MILELDDAKKFLRVDYDDDDDLITSLIGTAGELCLEISRQDEDDFDETTDTVRAAALYTVSYLYDNRNNPDYNHLKLNLRAMLSGIREAAF